MHYPADFWNERYASAEFVYGKEPNRFFEQELQRLKPGKLLLPCEGEGRNAVWAARQGWEVSAFDQSSMGKQKAERLAQEAGVSIDYRILSMPDLPYPAASFDVLALIFAHFHESHRRSWHELLGLLVKPGGTVIVEAFSKKQLHYQEKYRSGGPGDAALLYWGDELRNDFREFETVSISETEESLHEGNYHSGLAHVVRFVGRKV
jgi:SAM-dependent methyltransferase